jgi:exodeoxyribonuclease VIII
MEAAQKPKIADTIDYERIAKKTLSYSRLKEFKRSPLHFWHSLIEKKEATDAQRRGQLIDQIILTPDRVLNEAGKLLEDSQFIIQPPCDRRTNAGKAIYEDFLKKVEGKTIITEEELQNAKNLQEVVFENEIAMDFLSRVHTTQKRIDWQHKKTGLNFKGFLDGEGDNFYLELKSAANADPEVFVKDAFKFNYHLQGGMYVEGGSFQRFPLPDLIYIVVEPNPPYGIAVIEAPEEYIRLGMQEYNKLCDGFKYCLDNKLFHQSYQFRNLFTGINKMEVPAWMLKNLEE